MSDSVKKKTCWYDWLEQWLNRDVNTNCSTLKMLLSPIQIVLPVLFLP